MEINQLMKNMLQKYKILGRIEEIILEPRLASLLSKGIIEFDRCYFLHALLPIGFDVREAEQSSFDRTDLECTLNHIHIGDFIERDKKNKKVLIEQGICYAYSLQSLLPETEEFSVILAFTFDPIIDCNVRFHMQRPGERWLATDLEKYEEALLVLGKSLHES